LHRERGERRGVLSFELKERSEAMVRREVREAEGAGEGCLAFSL